MNRSKEYRIPIPPLQWDPQDALAAEYEVVAQHLKASIQDGRLLYSDLDLGFTVAGKMIRDAAPDASARFVLALVAHAAHFDALAKKVRALAANDFERSNWHHSCPEWEAVWPPRQVAAEALRRIMRRKLPLGAQHLIKLADWIADAEWHSDYLYPLKAFAKAVETYGAGSPSEIQLRASLSRVARTFRNSQSKDLPKLAHNIEALLGTDGDRHVNETSEPRVKSTSDPA